MALRGFCKLTLQMYLCKGKMCIQNYIYVYNVCIIRTLYWFKKFNIIKEILSLTACINQSDRLAVCVSWRRGSCLSNKCLVIICRFKYDLITHLTLGALVCVFNLRFDASLQGLNTRKRDGWRVGEVYSDVCWSWWELQVILHALPTTLNMYTVYK